MSCFSNETSDRCWSSLQKKIKRDVLSQQYRIAQVISSTRRYTKHSSVKFFSCENPFHLRKVILELHSSNLFLHRQCPFYSFKTGTYETVSGISSGFLKWPAHNKNLFSQSVGLCPGTLKGVRPKKKNQHNPKHTNKEKQENPHQKQQSEKMNCHSCNETS